MRTYLLDWLLSFDNPSVRYLTMRDLLPETSDTSQLRRARAQIMQWPPLVEMLERQLDDGSFPYRGKTPTAQPTLIAVCLMHRCGLDMSDRPAARAIEYLTVRHLGKGALSYTSGGSGILPCYLGVASCALIGMGALHTDLVQSSLRWLIEYQRFDHKGGRAGGEGVWPYRAPTNYGCWESVSCFHGVAGAFRALAAVPPAERSPELNHRLSEAIDYLRARRLYRRTGTDRPVVRHLVRPFLVGDYRSGLLDMLHGIADTGDAGLWHQDWVQEAVADMDGLTRDGRVVLATDYSSRLLDAPFETVGEPSRFLTYEWELVRRRLLGPVAV